MSTTQPQPTSHRPRPPGAEPGRALARRPRLLGLPPGAGPQDAGRRRLGSRRHHRPPARSPAPGAKRRTTSASPPGRQGCSSWTWTSPRTRVTKHPTVASARCSERRRRTRARRRRPRRLSAADLHRRHALGRTTPVLPPARRAAARQQRRPHRMEDRHPRTRRLRRRRRIDHHRRPLPRHRHPAHHSPCPAGSSTPSTRLHRSPSRRNGPLPQQQRRLHAGRTRRRTRESPRRYTRPPQRHPQPRRLRTRPTGRRPTARPAHRTRRTNRPPPTGSACRAAEAQRTITSGLTAGIRHPRQPQRLTTRPEHAAPHARRGPQEAFNGSLRPLPGWQRPSSRLLHRDLLHIDRRNTRPPPCPGQRGMCASHELGAAILPIQRDRTLRCVRLRRDQLLVRPLLSAGDRRRRRQRHTSGRTVHYLDHPSQPAARHLYAEQVRVVSTRPQHGIPPALSRQPQPSELTHRHVQIRPRYPLEIPGRQLHTTTRSHRLPTVATYRALRAGCSRSPQGGAGRPCDASRY